EQAGTQVGLGFVQGAWVEDFGGHAAGAVEVVLAADFLHFLLVGGDPDGAAGHVFDIRRQLGGELAPELLGIAGEGELRLGVVHDDDVAHAGGGGASACEISLDHSDAQSGKGAFTGAGGADDAAADDHDVI